NRRSGVASYLDVRSHVCQLGLTVVARFELFARLLRAPLFRVCAVGTAATPSFDFRQPFLVWTCSVSSFSGRARRWNLGGRAVSFPGFPGAGSRQHDCVFSRVGLSAAASVPALLSLVNGADSCNRV